MGNAIRDGQRNDHVTKLVGDLLRRDVDALVVAEIALSMIRTRVPTSTARRGGD